MSARNNSREISVTLSENLDDLMAKLARGQNVGRCFTLNQIRYENVGRELLTALPREAKTVIQLNYLDPSREPNELLWGIESLYSSLADILQTAQQHHVALTLGHSLNQPAQPLPFRDEQRTRLLRTSLPDEAPLSLFRRPDATVGEEATAVRKFLAALKTSLSQAYQANVWPQIDPSEVATFYQGQTLSGNQREYERSLVRHQIFATAQPEVPNSLR